MEHSPSESVVARLAKEFPTFNGTRLFIAVFTTARTRSLSWTKLIHYTPEFKINFNLSFQLCISFKRFLSSGFSTNYLYALLIFPTCATSNSVNIKARHCIHPMSSIVGVLILTGNFAWPLSSTSLSTSFMITLKSYSRLCYHFAVKRVSLGNLGNVKSDKVSSVRGCCRSRTTRNRNFIMPQWTE
jgi:hypothetical protein